MVLPVVKSLLVLDANSALECCRISLYLYHEEAFVLQIYDPLRIDCWFPFMHLVPIVTERYHYENRDYIYEEDLYGNSISFFFIHRSIDFSTNESSRTSMLYSLILSLVPRMIPKSIVWCLNCPLCMISLIFFVILLVISSTSTPSSPRTRTTMFQSISFSLFGWFT